MHYTAPAFTNRPAIKHVGGEWFVTLEDLFFHIGDKVTINVPKYYLTDLASIPKWARWAISKTDDHIRASIVHDYLCERGVMSRAAADGLFPDLLRADGLRGWKVVAMYLAVRIGALLPGKHTPPFEIHERANKIIRQREGYLP